MFSYIFNCSFMTFEVWLSLCCVWLVLFCLDCCLDRGGCDTDANRRSAILLRCLAKDTPASLISLAIMTSSLLDRLHALLIGLADLDIMFLLELII